GVHYTPTSGTLSFSAGATTRTFTVPILENTTVAPNKTFQLTLSNPVGPVTVVSPSLATVTIADNDVAGTVEFSAATYSVLENAGTAIITVTRSGGNASGVTVNYATADGTAGGADYVGTAGTVTFAAGETSKTFSVQLSDDNIAEGVETVNLSLNTPGGGAILGPRSTALLRIVDDELTFRFTASNFTVAEGGGSAVVTVERTGTSAGNVTVDYATGNGTATAGSDYTATSGTLIFSPGVNSRTFSVPILQDTLAEGLETINLTLSNPSGGAQLVASQSTAIVSITDDDLGGAIGFAATTFTGAEGTANAVITVTRTGGAASGVTVNYQTTDGTGTAGLDYTATSGTLTFAANQTSQTFTVPILDDALGEGTESVNLILSAPGGGAVLAGVMSAVLEIVDDEPHVKFSSATYTVSEGAGSATIAVQRGGVSTGTLTVDFAASDPLPPAPGRAVANVDYTAVSGTLSFGPGVLTRTFNVPILSDSLIEGDETVNLSLTNPTVTAGTATVVAPATAVLTITENDAGGVLQFNAATYTVNETAGEALITVSRTGGFGEVTVVYETGDLFAPVPPMVAQTGSAGSDYTSATGTLTFGAGETSKTFVIPILDDGTAEGTETVNLRLVNPMPNGVPGAPTLGPRTTAVLRILDDEQAVQFTAATFTVNEGQPVATVTVQRSGIVGTVTVDYATSPGTAAAGVDYQTASGTLTFGPGVSTGNFTIPIIDNTRVEADKTVNLTLSNPGGAALAAQSTAVLTIKENDRGGAFGVSAASIVENQGNVTITVSRTGGLASAVSVDYAAGVCGSVTGTVTLASCEFPAGLGSFNPV
ncbi:MAG: Calx-beta domain-containing protein, partial [Nocardioidaceae bacterium]